MIQIRVKICGITRPDDALAAAATGVDAIGLVFYPKSSRLVDVDVANEIIRALPPFVSSVGLFLDADASEVNDIIRRVPLDLLQFHGEESPAFCAQFGRPYIKAVPMRFETNVRAYAQEFETAKGLLLDSHGGDKIGGSGERFDWRRIPPDVGKPIILAGGLSPSNIAEAVRQVRPYGVDVSSGVEAAKGIKDAELIQLFMRNLSQVEQHA